MMGSFKTINKEIMKKISHEAPLQLLQKSRIFNDYDYALVHLFEQSEEYFDFFKMSLKLGREVILDNSVFELGEAYDSKKYCKWIDKLQPTYFVIPDKFCDMEVTIDNVKKWHTYPGKKMGVIQGNTLEEFKQCYEEIEPLVDKVAISFAQPLFEKLFPILDKDVARVFGRIYLINYLLVNNVINKDKDHHLLGASLPQEFICYRHSSYDFIKTIDTSSPVLHGLLGVRFKEYGLKQKVKTKMADIFFDDIKNEKLVEYNIKIMRTFL